MHPLTLHDHGFDVILLKEGQKTPIERWKEISRSRAELAAAIQRPCNIGIRCGRQHSGANVLGVDFDSGDVFEQVYPKLPVTGMLVRTPRGFHAYYQLPAGVIAPNRVHVDGLALDFRGRYAFLVSPPSRTEHGRYEFVSGPVDANALPQFPLDMLPREQPRTPAEVRSEPNTRETLETARQYLLSAGGAISGEGGHRKTFRLACRLVHPDPKGFGLTFQEGLELLLWWNPSCVPPWSEKELRHKLLDAIKCAN